MTLSRRRRVLAILSTFWVILSPMPGPAAEATELALKETPGEKEQLQACEKRLCTIVVKKPARGEDLKCALAKTWARDNIKSGATSSRLIWNFGDARCTLALAVPRETIVAAITRPEYAFEAPEHAVECQVVKDGTAESVRVTLAPKVAFKDGEAKTVWLNVKKVSGPTSIKALVWTAIGLEKGIGLFQSRMIKAINRFIAEKCPAV